MPGHRNLVSPPRLQGMLTEVHLHKRPVTTSSSEHQAASRGVGAGQATPARRQRRCRRAPGPRCPVATRRRQVPGDDGCGPAHAPGAASGVRGLRARGRAGAWSAAGPSAARAQEARVRAGVPRGAWRPWGPETRGARRLGVGRIAEVMLECTRPQLCVTNVRLACATTQRGAWLAHQGSVAVNP
jgi:hypothetical protein